MRDNATAILLCAGEGTRMNDTRTHKVCYEVAGIPVIIRQINNLKAAGIKNFIVVVGSKADKVMECLSGIDGIVYAYQPVQNGTGTAAKYGLSAAKSLGLGSNALIAMGDKLIAPDVIKALIRKHTETNSSVTFVVQPKSCNESGGRIIVRDGKVCGIYEKMDSCLLSLAALDVQSEDSYRAAIDKMALTDGKKRKLLNVALKNLGKLAPKVELGGFDFDADEIESCEFVNTATYMVNVKEMLGELDNLGSDNAQNELYLTEAINNIARKKQVCILPVYQPEKLLTYSTMQDLLALQRYFKKPQKFKSSFPTASEWINTLNSWEAPIRRKFKSFYGNDEEYINERKCAYISLLRAFIEKYGDKPVVISRSPGRVNLLGRHIEHRGGSINVMSINRETLLVASPREDDTVNMANTNPGFKEFSFSILDVIKSSTDDWIEFIESEKILKMVRDTRGDWSNYVKAGILRIQLTDKHRLLCGMDMLFSGNIPMAAGLSSSSSIVVATNEAIIKLNKIKDIKTKDFIHLCGEGEWFVGSRGGAGDHAAMKCSKRDMITHLEFCPFEIKQSVPFPSGYRIVVANSFVEAKKSAGAKDLFNQKVACYEIGFMLIKKLFPEYDSKLNYLKDINPTNLGVPQSRIYEMLLKLPERITPKQAYELLPEKSDIIEKLEKTYTLPEYYEIRSVILYGISECIRAEKCIELLEAKDYEAVGRLMNVSHNGDRVYENGKPYDYRASDSYIKRLIQDLKSEDAQKVADAQLYNQPGGYACSTETIDRIVDHVKCFDGVLGCELSGAGLGGCIIILVKKQRAKALIDDLKSFYYDPKGLPLGANIFIPVAGSAAL